MVSFITILLFFVYLWGSGFTATYYLKKNQNFLERQLVNLGIGLAVFPLLAIILNFFHLPLDWKLFLVLSLAFPLYIFIKERKSIKIPKLRLTKSSLILILVLLIAVFSFYTYTKGAFAYPYLEDEDPWGHSVGVKYVALEKNAYDPELADVREIDPVLSYIDPYPPAYDVLMGILHQTSPNLNWTLKFFNALIISLGFIFFYLFAKSFMKNRNKALLATFVLAMIPCYLSHFIWAHALVVTLFFPVMYALERIRIDKKWAYLAAFLIGSVWVSQNVSQPLKISTMILLYLIVVSITSKKLFKSGFTALFGGVGLSFFWWGAMLSKYGLTAFLAYFGVGRAADASSSLNIYVAAASGSVSVTDKVVSLLKSLTSSGGTASRAYTFNDFFVAKSQNMINNPIGIGIVISLLVLVGLVFILWKYKFSLVKKKNTWLAVTLFWLIFTFWGVNGGTFHISVARGAFRVWMLLAIPIALVAAEGAFFLKNLFTKSKMIKTGVILLILIGIIFTSGVQKYEHNTVVWPTSGSFSNQAVPFEYGYWFETIPANTNVFTYAPRDKLTIGYGAFSCLWCQEIIDFRKEVLHKDAQELHSFLKNQEYEYLIINPTMDFKNFKHVFGEENTTRLLPQRYNEIQTSGLFTPVHIKENMFGVFKVN